VPGDERQIDLDIARVAHDDAGRDERVCRGVAVAVDQRRHELRRPPARRRGDGEAGADVRGGRGDAVAPAGPVGPGGPWTSAPAASICAPVALMIHARMT
jgi:hypothetical protein